MISLLARGSNRRQPMTGCDRGSLADGEMYIQRRTDILVTTSHDLCRSM
jgi:hypothetical protein